MPYSLTSFCKYLPRFLRRTPNQSLEPATWNSGKLLQKEGCPEAGSDRTTPLQQRNSRRNGRSVINGRRMTGIGPILKMTQSVYLEILDDLVEQPFRREKAGMLMGPTAEDDLITQYIPDKTGRATYSSFTLDAESLNRTLHRHKNVGLDCKGIVHVHPPGILRPSFGDLQYVAKLFANPKNEETTQVMLPIVCNGRLYPYLIDADNPREIVVPNLILV